MVSGWFLLVPSIPPAASHRGCIITALLHGGLWWAVVGHGGMKWGHSPMARRVVLAQYLAAHPCTKGQRRTRPSTRPWLEEIPILPLYDAADGMATMRQVLPEDP